MKVGFGWTLLSRDALRRAETQLREDVEGVRDEVGFLSLHQAYADRFFPGTSVLHTRLRYALFVPWIYQDIARRADQRRPAAAIEHHELELTRRLREAGEAGVIGIRSYPNPTAQPPSLIYWSALAAWRILRPSANSSTPSRQAVHRTLARTQIRQQLHDDDRQLLIDEEPLFCSVPGPPACWHDATQRLDFRLEACEEAFLRNCLIATERPGEDASSLLARLVDQRIEMTTDRRLDSHAVRRAADRADREALMRAHQAAALSAIGRGVYAALVEELRDRHDRLPTEDLHRSNLERVVSEFARDALSLEVDALSADAPHISRGIVEVLRATQSWLRTPGRPVTSLLEPYERAEGHRKGRRARLPRTLAGRERRAEWTPAGHPPATPLHYRWSNVRRLLLDLQGAS